MRSGISQQDAIAAIMDGRARRNFCLPNYTPLGWFECDIFEMTERGFWREYEVKLTHSDFLKDKSKSRPEFGYSRAQIRTGEAPTKSKYSMLEEHSINGPTHFWYVCPESIISESELPNWAGLIYLRPSKYNFLREVLVKKAPFLGRKKCDAKVVEHARGICYYRMQNLYSENARLKRRKSDAVRQAEIVENFNG